MQITSIYQDSSIKHINYIDECYHERYVKAVNNVG